MYLDVMLSLLVCASGCSSDGAATGPQPLGADGGTPNGSTKDAGAGDAAAPPGFATRPYAVTVPSKYDPKVGTPLVLLLHGYSETAKWQDDYFHLSALAEERTFLVALPEGTVDPFGNRVWDATDACCNLAGQPVDDSGYLEAVITDMKQRYNVDPKRVYVAGHSNGGFMAHRLACDHASEIAAIVSLAGAVFADASKCNPAMPVAVLEVHGTSDELIKYGGGRFVPLVPEYPSATATVATWAAKNGCDPALTPDGTTLDLVADLPGEETKVARHACAKGAAELWTMEGGTHVPTLQPTFAKAIYDFLERHPKP
jgi:polyhydroxybutyrate depolymerase